MSMFLYLVNALLSPKTAFLLLLWLTGRAELLVNEPPASLTWDDGERMSNWIQPKFQRWLDCTNQLHYSSRIRTCSHVGRGAANDLPTAIASCRTAYMRFSHVLVAIARDITNDGFADRCFTDTVSLFSRFDTRYIWHVVEACDMTSIRTDAIVVYLTAGWKMTHTCKRAVNTLCDAATIAVSHYQHKVTAAISNLKPCLASGVTLCAPLPAPT